VSGNRSDARAVRRLAQAAVAGIGVFAGIVLLLHAVRPEYDIVTRFISEYAVTDPVPAAAAGIALGLGAMALAKALRAAVPRHLEPRAGVVLLWVFGLCAVIFGVFPADEFPTVNPPSWHGIIHAVAAFIGFVCFSAGSLLVSFRLRRVSGWQGHARLLTTTAALSTILLFCLYAELPIVGLVERVAVAVILAWMALAARALLRWAAGGAPAPASRAG